MARTHRRIGKDPGEGWAFPGSRGNTTLRGIQRFGDQRGNTIQDAAHAPLREDTTQRDKPHAPQYGQLFTSNGIPRDKRNFFNPSEAMKGA
jgi:ADP-ribose pyrophosphatase YjhB (NUDIX family)